MRAIADWWDSVELWLTQLPFTFQVLLAVLVVLPVTWFVAVGVDRLSDRIAAALSTRTAARTAARRASRGR
jgi:hypothetical protein